ncbi:minichromosome maintenance domain-containing protein 2 isoform X2 [Mustela erminea]|uniref:minichromosome maintenance domain-containing protein 2 isoform X2 n=1 Tax=Mustela erminea TaxID=36723 RepID=UPI0013872F19|nr:minichromosome maintenance domain-containing protein 2 isoform X2 [Mustela erminea]
MSNLKMKEAALIYLDRSGGLQKFIDDCKYYNDSKQSYAVYRFNILVNPSDIVELDAELGNHILHKPLKAAQVFQSVCFTAVKTLSLIGQLQTETQINIVLKLTHLPPLRSYILDPCEFPLDYASQRFYMMQGIVIAMTTVTKYTQGARFLCSDEACPLSKGFQYIRVHVPGATESVTVRNDFLCNLCSSSLQEDRKFRVLGDKQIVEIITAKALHAFRGYSKNQPFRFQSLTIFLRDESVSKMNIGNEYKIIGIPTCVKTSQTAVCIEANSIISCNPKGDLASHKKDKLEQLQSVVESRNITVYIPGKKFGDGVNQQMTFPVQCSFWSFVDMDSSSRKNMQKTNTLIGQMDCSLIPTNLLEAFGLLIKCNESSPCSPLLSTVQHTLKKAIDPEGQLYVASKKFTTEDFEKLLAFAKNLNVEFSLEAERMIHGYYLASRRIRTDSISGSKLSASALKYLVSLAEAHARLNLRSKVLKEDALIAALLFETSLTLKYGATVFCVAPNAVFPFELYNEEYLEQRDIYLTQCQQQLQQFITTYGPGTALSTSDE